MTLADDVIATKADTTAIITALTAITAPDLSTLATQAEVAALSTKLDTVIAALTPTPAA